MTPRMLSPPVGEAVHDGVEDDDAAGNAESDDDDFNVDLGGHGIPLGYDTRR